MSELKSISDCIEAKKGSFIGVVISAGDLKSGTKDDKDWSRKSFIIEDNTARITAVMWNNDVNALKLGQKYEFTNWWFKEHEGQIQITKGNYGKLKEVEGSFGDSNTPQTSQASEIDPPRTQDLPSLPELDENTQALIHDNTILLLQIESTIRKSMQEFITPTRINDSQVGRYSRLIFNMLKQQKEEQH